MEVTELTATTDSLSSVSTPSGGPESSAGDSVKQKSLSPPATTKPSDGTPTPEAAMPAPRAKNQVQYCCLRTLIRTRTLKSVRQSTCLAHSEVKEDQLRLVEVQLSGQQQQILQIELTDY